LARFERHRRACIKKIIGRAGRHSHQRHLRDHQLLHPQSRRHIAQGVDAVRATRKKGHRPDQAHVRFGDTETPELMPAPDTLCPCDHWRRLAEVRKDGNRADAGARDAKASFPCAMKTANLLACPLSCCRRSNARRRARQRRYPRYCRTLYPPKFLPEGLSQPDTEWWVTRTGNIRDWRPEPVMPADRSQDQSWIPNAVRQPHGGGAVLGQKIRQRLTAYLLPMSRAYLAKNVVARVWQRNARSS